MLWHVTFSGYHGKRRFSINGLTAQLKVMENDNRNLFFLS